MKISLAMIVKDAEDSIIPCLLSVADAVDEVVIVDTGSTDGTKDAILSVAPKAKIQSWLDPNRHPERGWISDFACARNISFGACSGDAILWLDADDVVSHRDLSANPAACLRSVIETYMEVKSPQADVIELTYDYKLDEFGNCLLRLPRYRVLRRECFRWVWPVHEELMPLRFVKQVDHSKGGEFILHRKKQGDEKASAERNLWVMERYMGQGGEMDARLWSNVAGSRLHIGDHEGAVDAYMTAIEKYDDDDQKYICLLRCGAAFRGLGELSMAMEAFGKAATLFPERRQPTVSMAETAMDQGNVARALAFCDLSERQAAHEGFVEGSESLLSVPTYTRARAYMELGEYEMALEAYRSLGKRFPGAAQIHGPVKLLEGLLERQGRYEALCEAARLLPPDLGRECLRNAPDGFETYPEIARAKRPDIPDGKPHAVIYCGNAVKPWGPSSLSSGIGGSEEAVILLSREFSARGWHVEVFGFPAAKDQGIDEHGVVWLPYAAWQKGDACDVFIGWRQYRPHAAFRQGLHVGARASWLWLHDTIQEEFFTPDWADMVDGMFCLSRSHASALPKDLAHMVTDTQNGLDPDFFVDGPNDPLKFIYASSPDRGLVELLREWPAIEEALPGAELHVYYGFTENYLAGMAAHPALRQIKHEVEKLREAKGVVWHGMVGQEELARAYADCGFMVYPTSWSETSFIGGMRAQALGCIPITSRFLASSLPETCKYDLGPAPREGMIRDDPEWLREWRDAVIEASGRTDLSAMRADMKAWARQEFSWAKVADQWIKLFLPSSAPSPSPAPEPRQGEAVTLPA